MYKYLGTTNSITINERIRDENWQYGINSGLEDLHYHLVKSVNMIGIDIYHFYQMIMQTLQLTINIILPFFIPNSFIKVFYVIISEM